jgi:hypothetical protein
MKKEIVILFLLTLGLTTMNAQSTLRAKRSNIYLSHLIANDSLFLQKLDSIIFNFNCTEIENKNNLRVFNVYSKKNKQKENSYRLSIQLDNQLHLLNKNEVKGYF